VDFITPLLHGLAYVGVYLINVLIYETIAVAIWFAVSYATFNTSLPGEVSDRIVFATTLILGLAFLAFCVLYFFGIAQIIPLPVFR
jgi:hypothetical protein